MAPGRGRGRGRGSGSQGGRSAGAGAASGQGGRSSAQRGASSQHDPAASSQRPVAWNYFFQPEHWDPEGRVALLVGQLSRAFLSEQGARVLSAGVQRCDERYVLHVDYAALVAAATDVLGPESDLPTALELQPSEALASIAIAASELLFRPPHSLAASLLGPGHHLGKLHVRLVNHRASQCAIRGLRSSLVNRLVTVRGMVVRAGPVVVQVSGMEFTCTKCGAARWQRFEDMVYTQPTACAASGCRGRTFVGNRQRALCVDWQRVKLQETTTDAETHGQIPRSVEVELMDDLAGSCRAGDFVTLVGVLRVGASAQAGGGVAWKVRDRAAPTAAALHQFYVQGVSVTLSKRAHRGDAGTVEAAGAGAGATAEALAALALHGGRAPARIGDLLFSLTDLKFVLAMRRQCGGGDAVRQLVRSFCPQICGSEFVKMGILLCLFGGVTKTLAGGESDAGAPSTAGREEGTNLRGNIHCLLVGDPGLGKSQMLRFACQVAPRGLYVCGNTCTSAGLTVSVTREGSSGEFTFEAGAAVLGDRGLVCVDEFDKMRDEHAALLEVMEQQEVSVAKAGLVASLPARTSVLAASNPVQGAYDRGRSVAKNVGISGPMLSRFDLVFVMMDCPDHSKDRKLVAQLMAMHGDAGAAEAGCGLDAAAEAALDGAFASPGGRGESGAHVGGGLARRRPLAERLRAQPGEEDEAVVPPALLRKYIAYARQMVRPKLTEAAAARLQSFWLEMRAKVGGGMSEESVSVTTRQLDGLVRLAEARARMELRSQVLESDASDVVELMMESLLGAQTAGGSLFGGEANAKKRRRGTRVAEAERFLEALCARAQQRGGSKGGEFTVAELYEVGDAIDVQCTSMADFVERLNDAGELLKKGGGSTREQCIM
ncbi:unnamed protein product [Pedinophyceae sp. YPF-701]|nr:unnamed protein product [Pedinophyceae sp. YPF-701]